MYDYVNKEDEWHLKSPCTSSAGIGFESRMGEVEPLHFWCRTRVLSNIFRVPYLGNTYWQGKGPPFRGGGDEPRA